ncbi:MAG: adenylate/guanylate cyclase domain-containing protein [Rhodoferax sp.]|nr:adenylate/guanylate cyclase domain-containing protein [Rhodoferax sp.]MCF8210845.1 adenylate/guanylate cyclase domain-containing protein [Rhodoferax sp.]
MARSFSALNLVPFLAILVSAVLFLFDPLPLQVLRNAIFDQYQRWHPRSYQESPVRVVDIDDESLSRLGQWPWPRTLVADLLTQLQQARVAAIGLDVVFAEPDRTSPRAMLGVWKLPENVCRRLAELPDHDTVMARAVAEGGVVLGFALERSGRVGTAPAKPFRVVNSGEPALPFLHPFSGAVTSIAVLEQAAAGNGAMTFVPDPDGVVRRVPLLLRLGETVVPSLVAESLRVAQGQRNYLVKTAAEPGTGLQEVRIGAMTVPVTPRGEMWVHYTGAVPQRSVPAWKVLAGEFAADQLDGAIVLVGTSAQGLMDLRASPMGHIMPGVEAHAQALEQILDQTWLQRPAWAGSIEALALLLGGCLVAFVSLRSSAVASAATTLVLLLALGWGAWTGFVQHGVLLDPLTPSLAMALSFIVGSVIHHFNSERQGRWVREAFSRYVSPNRVDFLVDHPGQLELGGKRQECSFIFTDLADFTTLMEKLDPADAVALLNAYLDRMVHIAFDHGGTLDRIVGDAVAIMFSAPVVQPDHRERALRCALAMHAFAQAYVAEQRALGVPFGNTRIGIHTGDVIVGNFGGTTMFDYRALGDAVNTAARLESVNKHLGTLVCISEATLSGCPDAVARPIGRLVLKGKSVPLMVYEPLLATEGGVTVRDLDYEAAYGLLKGAADQAVQAFESLALARPWDPLTQLHLRRLRAGASGETIVFDEK